MKNTERQKQLDERKYFESIKWQRDLCGIMEYCYCCPYKEKPFNACTISQEQREQESACAKAYNKLKRKI